MRRADHLGSKAAGAPPLQNGLPRNIYPCGERGAQRPVVRSPSPCCPPRGSTIRLSTRIKLVVAAWLVAEALAFYLVAEAIGYPEALLVAFITSLFGWTLLKRAGASVALKLRAMIEGRPGFEGRTLRVADDTLAGFGAAALLMPGFVSDVVGLALLVPAVRDRLARRLAGATTFSPSGAARPTGPQTIDLAPDEWRRGEAPGRPAPKP